MLIIPKRIFIDSISRAQYNQLSMLIHDLRNDGIDKIQSLLIRQSGNQSDHEFMIILYQSQFLLQPAFILSLLIQYIGDIIVHIQSLICGCIPDIIIDSVYDSSQFS